MHHTRWLIDFNKIAEHDGEEDVVMFWFLAYFGEPLEALYGDFDVNLAYANKAQGVNVRDGGGARVVVMRGCIARQCLFSRAKATTDEKSVETTFDLNTMSLSFQGADECKKLLHIHQRREASATCLASSMLSMLLMLR